MEGLSGGRLESICEVVIDVKDVNGPRDDRRQERCSCRLAVHLAPTIGLCAGPRASPGAGGPRAIQYAASPSARPQPWLPPFVALLTFPSAGHDIIRFFRTSSVREPRRPSPASITYERRQSQQLRMRSSARVALFAASRTGPAGCRVRDLPIYAEPVGVEEPAARLRRGPWPACRPCGRTARRSRPVRAQRTEHGVIGPPDGQSVRDHDRSRRSRSGPSGAPRLKRRGIERSPRE